jgi:hypothetical protein
MVPLWHFFSPPLALFSFLSPLSFLYALVFFLHIFIAFSTSFGLNSFLPLFFRPILDAFISFSLSSLDLSPSQYTRPLCVNIHITVSTLHVHGWLKNYGLLLSSPRTYAGQLLYIRLSVYSTLVNPFTYAPHTLKGALLLHLSQLCYTYCPWMGRVVLYDIERGWSLEPGGGGWRLHFVTKSLTL